MNRSFDLTIRILLVIAGVLLSCDRRTAINRTRDPISFGADVTVIKDYSTGMNLADISFTRENAAFSDGIITVGDTEIPNVGGSLYFLQSSLFSLSTGLNEITFESPDDQYLQAISFDLPDSFGVTDITPQINYNADNVFVQWSSSGSATRYILAVATFNYGADGTEPFRKLLAEQDSSYVIPDTTFENASGDIVPGTYYIYLIAFNRGFGPYFDIQFPVPEGLSPRAISDPNGSFIYGTVAPLDSIMVPVI